MILVRLLPLILATLLFAAHIMRFNGLPAALLVLALLVTLFIPRSWILNLWQVLIGLALIEWLRTAIILIKMRLVLDLPYVRLALIMAAVILFNGFVIYWLNHKKLRRFYKEPDRMQASEPS